VSTAPWKPPIAVGTWIFDFFGGVAGHTSGQLVVRFSGAGGQDIEAIFGTVDGTAPQRDAFLGTLTGLWRALKVETEGGTILRQATFGNVLTRLGFIRWDVARVSLDPALSLVPVVVALFADPGVDGQASLPAFENAVQGGDIPLLPAYAEAAPRLLGNGLVETAERFARASKPWCLMFRVEPDGHVRDALAGHLANNKRGLST
jgi:hypothetical protein